MIRECSCEVGISHVFIDLDNTLYINDDVDAIMIEKIQQYMTECLGIAKTDVSRLRRELYGKYNLTLTGLLAEGYEVDVALFQEFVHDLEYEKLIFPDPELKELLSKITQPKYLFTNGTEMHAKRCLERLEMEGLFDGVISFDSLQRSALKTRIDLDQCIVSKPDPAAFKLALEEVGAQAETSLFVDDSRRNITTADGLHMSTLWIKQGMSVNVAERVAPSLMHLPKIYPSLFCNSVREYPIPQGF